MSTPTTRVAPADRRLAWSPATLAHIDARLIDEPVATPVRTSFGTMHSRPGLVIRLTCDDGVQGFGEVWCNFPEGGARYKATLLARYVRPALAGQRIERPEAVHERLRTLFAVLRLQCADYGAIEQLIAGVDQAAWDLFAKRAGQPFWKLLGGARDVPVYASGIGPAQAAQTVQAQQAAGHTRFKIKLGFDDDADARNVAAARTALPAGAELMVDVNQAWSTEQAAVWLPRLAAAGVLWCEEPLRADRPWPEWRALAALAPTVKLAAGENLLGVQSFVDAVEQGGIGVLQPDVGKWGGISQNLALARRLGESAGSEEADAWICPHWLSGGIGLMASLQFKAVIGGPGAVEMDVNPNRQRSEAFAEPWLVQRGTVTLPETPGLVAPLADWLLDADGWRSAAADREVADVR